MDRRWVVGLTFLTHGVLDTVTTGIGISMYGIEWEGNPFMAFLMQNGGFLLTATVNIFGVLLMCIALWWACDRIESLENPRWRYWLDNLVLFIPAVGVAIVLNNVLALTFLT